MAPTDSGDGPLDGPLYIGAGRPTCFAWRHAAQGASSGIGVLVCPPFGYDAICAYRGLRAWADRLAGDGHATLRIELPGTGDSAGTPTDDGLWKTWSEAVAAGARVLRDDDGCRRVAVVGLGLGGLLAIAAASNGAPIDDFALWAVPARGRALTRELRAFSMLARSTEAAPAPASWAPLPDGALEAGGYYLAPATVAALNALDLTKTPLPAAGARRVLMLGRDDIPADARLQASLRDAGASVELADGSEWSTFLAPPHLSQLPTGAIEATRRWLAAGAPDSELDAGPAPATSATLALGDGLLERPLRPAMPNGRAFAILTEREDSAERLPLKALLLNVGAEKRSGPNRMWTELARRWAAAGISVVRVDVPGIGDADGPEAVGALPPGTLYRPENRERLVALLDALEQDGLPAGTVVAGVCSGAFWSFQLALADARVVAAAPLNPPFFHMSDAPAPAEDPEVPKSQRRTPIQHRLLAFVASERSARLRRMLDGPRARAAIAMAWSLWSRGDALEDIFEGMAAREQTIAIGFSAGEGLLGEMKREGRIRRLSRWPRMSVTEFVSPPETHTFQPVRLQEEVHVALDAVLAGELARVPSRPRVAA